MENKNQILTTSPIQICIIPQDFDGPDTNPSHLTDVPQLGTDFDWTEDFEIDQTTCLKHFVEFNNLTLVSHESTPGRYYEYDISAVVTGTKKNLDTFLWNVLDSDPAETTRVVVGNRYVVSYRVPQPVQLSNADKRYDDNARRERPDLYPPG